MTVNLEDASDVILPAACVPQCIGHRNHASFIRFLTYVNLACTYHFWMLSFRVWGLAQGTEWSYLVRRLSQLTQHELQLVKGVFDVLPELTLHITSFLFSPPHQSGSQTQPDGLEVVMIILNFAACVPVLCCVGVFWIYHVWSLFGNTTTIEAWEKDKVQYSSYLSVT